MEYSVQDLNSANAKAWDKLNVESVQGSFYHTLKWKSVVDRFSSLTNYFLVYRDGEPVALCPLRRQRWSVKGLIWWGELTGDYDAPLIINDPDDPQIGREIVFKCKEIMKKEKLSYASLNLPNATKNCFRSMNLPPSPLTGPAAGIMTLNLEEYTPQKIWSDVFRKDERRKSELALREGWVVEEVTSDQDLTSFYTYFKANMEHLRSNYPSQRYFECLTQTFQPSREMLIFLLHNDETIGGGLLVFLFEPKKTMYYGYVALNRNVSNRYSPGFALFWHGVKKAAEIGYTSVVFGGTHSDPRDVHYRIKASFGCRFEPRYGVSFPRSRVIVNSALRRLASIRA